MQPAADQIKAERNRQIGSEGYTEKKDIGRAGELKDAAFSYLLASMGYPDDAKEAWPWDEDYFKPTTELRNLIKAGALVAAAIDSINNSKDTDK